MRKNITQDMKYRQSLLKYAAKYGVSRAGRKYNKMFPLSLPLPLNWIKIKPMTYAIMSLHPGQP